VSSAPGGRSLTQIVVRGVGLAGSGFVLSQALTFAFYLVLARLATPGDFGAMAAGSIAVGIGFVLAESGMMAALIYRRDRVEEAANTALVATLLGGLGLSLLALLLAPLIGWYFQSERIGLVAAALSGYLVLRAGTIVPDALMQRRFSFLRRVVVEPLAVLAFGITAIILCARGLGVWGLVLGQYASVVVQVVLGWALARWRPRLRLASFAIWKEMAEYGRHVLSGEMVHRFAAEIDTLVVGRFLGAPALGQYRYALRFAAQPFGALVNVGSFVLLPALARISDDEVRFRGAFTRAFRWMSVVAIPAGLIFVPLGTPLLLLLLGPTWRQAAIAIAAMGGYPAARAYDSLASETWKATGNPRRLPRMHLLSAALSLVLMLALVPFGLNGVALALSLVSIGVAAYAIRGMSQVVGLPVRFLLGEIWPPLLAAVVMAGSILALDRLVIQAGDRGAAAGLALLGAEGLLAVAVYLSVLALVRPRTGREILDGLRSLRRRQGVSAPAA
jgi:PST family polysaccharide transporter